MHMQHAPCAWPWQVGLAGSGHTHTHTYTYSACCIYGEVGLAGSSAIVTAAFQCLMAFYQLGERDIPKALQPDFVLSVEMEELFIQAAQLECLVRGIVSRVE